MDSRLFCEYKFKFYINASHSIIIGGRQGDVHPHTWEILLDILVQKDAFMAFNDYEKVAHDFFAQYQDCVLNDIKPFDTLMPTLENIVDYFGGELRGLMKDVGGTLMKIEGGETPTRSYGVSYIKDDEFITDVGERTGEALDQVIDDMLQRVLD